MYSVEQDNQTNILVFAYGYWYSGILTFWPSNRFLIGSGRIFLWENQILYGTFSWMRLRHSQHGRKRLRLSFENFLTNYWYNVSIVTSPPVIMSSMRLSTSSFVSISFDIFKLIWRDFPLFLLFIAFQLLIPPVCFERNEMFGIWKNALDTLKKNY